MAGPTYGVMVERFLQRLANEGRSQSTLTAYRADLDDTMLDVAIELGLLPPRRRLPDDAGDRESMVLPRSTHWRSATSPPTISTAPWPSSAPGPTHGSRPTPNAGPTQRSPATVARRTSAMRSFFAWAYKTQRIPNDPAALLSPPKRRKRVPRALEQSLAGGALSNARSQQSVARA